MIQPIGRFVVSAPGTLVPVYVPAQVGKAYPIHAIQFQSVPGNQGIVYVGTSTLVRATFAQVLGLVARPSYDADGQTVALPAWAAAHTIAPNGMALNVFYLDADFANDAVIVTVIVT